MYKPATIDSELITLDGTDQLAVSINGYNAGWGGDQRRQCGAVVERDSAGGDHQLQPGGLVRVSNGPIGVQTISQHQDHRAGHDNLCAAVEGEGLKVVESGLG